MLSHHSKRPSLEPPEPARPSKGDNVVDLQLRILPRHVSTLTLWLQAGRCMGLCDASAIQSRRGQIEGVEPGTDYVLVWVRENPDPAYMITPTGTHWVVSDCVRQQALGQLRTFEDALEFIRPVLGATRAA